MPRYYIGLMSGTSMDALDAALVDFSSRIPKLVATHKSPLSDNLRRELHDLCAHPEAVNMWKFHELDTKMADLSVRAVQELLEKSSLSRKNILAIGSHGQTVFHYPQAGFPFTQQIGNANIIAEQTGITTVAGFRGRDMAAGGEGAPLTPAFHSFLFRIPKENRIVLNLGGIANLSYLPADKAQPVLGFDTGPANVLLDRWIYQYKEEGFDKGGEWAASANPDEDLLKQLLSDPYFSRKPPKSTGPGYFNLSWLDQKLTAYERPVSPDVVQSTLCDLTAKSVALAIKNYLNGGMGPGLILVCGGGAKNGHLRKRLEHYCSKWRIGHCDDFDISAEWMEAMAFAWLAKRRLELKPGNLPEVTGARNPTLLGSIYHKNPDTPSIQEDPLSWPRPRWRCSIS